MLPKHTKKYKTIKRSPQIRTPMKTSVHIIMTRTSIPYSKLRKPNSLLIEQMLLFKLKIFNFKTSQNLLYHFFISRNRHVLINSDDKSYSICIRKLFSSLNHLPNPPKKDSRSKNYAKEEFYMTRNSDITALHLNIFVMY